jgi:hypothetical protein
MMTAGLGDWPRVPLLTEGEQALGVGKKRMVTRGKD